VQKVLVNVPRLNDLVAAKAARNGWTPNKTLDGLLKHLEHAAKKDGAKGTQVPNKTTVLRWLKGDTQKPQVHKHTIKCIEEFFGCGHGELASSLSPDSNTCSETNLIPLRTETSNVAPYLVSLAADFSPVNANKIDPGVTSKARVSITSRFGAHNEIFFDEGSSVEYSAVVNLMFIAIGLHAGSASIDPDSTLAEDGSEEIRDYLISYLGEGVWKIEPKSDATLSGRLQISSLCLWSGSFSEDDGVFLCVPDAAIRVRILADKDDASPSASVPQGAKVMIREKLLSDALKHTLPKYKRYGSALSYCRMDFQNAD